MKFIVTDLLYNDGWRVMQIEPEVKHIASFPDFNEFAKNIAYDYCSFLNNKYCDKDINKEWPKPNNKQRLQYHSEQLMLLLSGRKVKWSEDGDCIKEV